MNLVPLTIGGICCVLAGVCEDLNLPATAMSIGGVGILFILAAIPWKRIIP